MSNEKKEYIPLTHEELLAEVYRMMHDLTLEEQAAFVEKCKQAIGKK